ncbi:N-acetylmuramoyl-L-alanine amidase [Candidatus Kinetoplastibacterium sorsogonicusi]|nr:N-acetylmuramoyl-L-alanine amidase [Candidatus Kinetoplastibacterium sorsogonicusi]
MLFILFYGISTFSYANSAIDVRIWHSNEYKRITIELDNNISVKKFFLKDPNRLVVDIHNLKINKIIQKISSLIKCDDPYIIKIKIAQYEHNIVRVVFYLKKDIEPQIFILKPVSNYNYRLILDLYTKSKQDSLMSLIDITKKNNIIKDPIDDIINSIEFRSHRKKFNIVIDPGHGGEDPGAIGKVGLYEKDIVLSIAKKLKILINNTPNMNAYLTREGDYFVPLNVRIKKARIMKADLLISIHTNSWFKSNARGTSVFVLSNVGASSTQAKWIANKENSSDLIGGINLTTQDQNIAKILLDLSTTLQINNSIKLGNFLLNEFKKFNVLYKKNVEHANFAILKIPDIPSVLIETAFISNPLEEQLLKSNDYQNNIAKAILICIKKYFDIKN